MLERIEGLVLDVVKHNDKHNVVTLYTRRRGRMAFLVPVGTSRTGRMRNAALALMGVVGADVNIRPGKELYPLRQVQPLRLWHAVYANPVKTSLIFFLAEFIHRLVRQYPADERLWAFLLDSMEMLEALPADHISNFHIAFLIRLLPLAGIEPSVSRWEPGDRFDMLRAEMAVMDRSGLYHYLRNLLPEDESRAIPLLLRMDYANMHRFRISRQQRQLILDRLLSYYSTHLPLGTDFRSLPVLRELFS